MAGPPPGFHLHVTPTSSSWLNLVERLFAELATRMLRRRSVHRGVHGSVAVLEADIRTWLEHWDDNPCPYIWTKTAEQILESIGAYRQRLLQLTNDSRRWPGAAARAHRAASVAPPTPHRHSRIS